MCGDETTHPPQAPFLALLLKAATSADAVGFVLSTTNHGDTQWTAGPGAFDADAPSDTSPRERSAASCCDRHAMLHSRRAASIVGGGRMTPKRYRVLANCLQTNAMLTLGFM